MYFNVLKEASLACWALLLPWSIYSCKIIGLYNIFLVVPGGFSARDYGIAVVRSLSVVVVVCRRGNHEISTEVSLRLL